MRVRLLLRSLFVPNSVAPARSPTIVVSPNRANFTLAVGSGGSSPQAITIANGSSTPFTNPNRSLSYAATVQPAEPLLLARIP